jgi:hypothetical protein
MFFCMFKLVNFFTINLYGYFGLSIEGRGLFKKVPRFVVPSDSEASTPHFLLPRVARYPQGKRGIPLACARGDSGRVYKKNIFETASEKGEGVLDNYGFMDNNI